MIRTLAYFQNSTALNGREPLSALIRGAQRHGIKAIPESMTADAAVIWSVLWYGRMRNNQTVFDHYRAHGRPVIVIDVGALRRDITWKVAVNHMTAQGFYGHKENLDWDRPGHLGLQLGTAAAASPAVMVAAQHAHSLQMKDWPDPITWINTRIEQLRQHTDRPIVVRPHPRSPVPVDRIPAGVTIQQPKKVVHSYDSFDLNFGWHAIVNHNSGVGIQSALAGCTTVVDATSLAHPVSTDMANIEHPVEIDREKWFIEISHTEYTVDELAQGQWYTRLEPCLND